MVGRFLQGLRSCSVYRPRKLTVIKEHEDDWRTCKVQAALDTTDKKLLDLAQQGLPVTQHPFRHIGSQLGITASEVIERLKALKENGYIRRIGGVFDSKKMGYESTVVAVKVPEETDFYKIAGAVCSHPGVTHCYRRDDELNLWFTLTFRDTGEKQAVLKALVDSDEAMDVFDLPAEQRYKLKVFFQLSDANND